MSMTAEEAVNEVIAQRDELAKALEPFAALVEYADTELKMIPYRDKMPVSPYAADSPTYGDCRRAAEVLAKTNSSCAPTNPHQETPCPIPTT